MPPDDAQMDATANVISRMGERLASLEASTRLEIAALKQDTETIRSNLHRALNTMQEFIISSQADKAILREHLMRCDTRGQRIEKLIWGVAGGIGALFLIWAQHFMGWGK